MNGQSHQIWRRLSLVALALAVGLGAVAPVLAADDACAGYAQDKRIRGLGGRNTFGDPVADLDELRAQLDTLEPDLRHVLDNRDLAHVSDELIAAIRSGEGVSESEVVRGDKYGWIAYRKGGEPSSLDGVCMDTRPDEKYAAWLVEVPVGKEMGDAPEARCGATVRRDCDGGVTVDASSSSEGVKVMMGGETIIPNDGSQASWSGEDANPYTEELEFTVTAQTQGTKEVTNHRFVVPRICLNIAYAGSTTSTEAGAVKTCEKVIPVESCEAPEPSCAIALGADTIKAGEPLAVDVSGHWDEGGLELGVQDADGNALSEPVVGQPPTNVTFDDPGRYTIVGTATNEVGDTATCSAAVQVKGRWTLRPYVAYLSQDEMVGPVDIPSIPEVSLREKFGISNGVALGVDLERRFTERVGLDLGLMYGQLDSTYTFDRNDEWANDTDDLGLLLLTVGPAFHLTPDARADVYFVPYVGLAQLDDGSYSVLGESHETDFGSEFAWGAKLGVDIPFSEGSPWGLNLAARYFAFDVDTNLADDSTIDVAPLGLSLGLAYDF